MKQIEKILTEGEETDWLGALPEYQQEIIRSFLADENDPEAAAERWLSAGGPRNTFPLGGQAGESVFLEKLREEVAALLCGAERYEEERQKLVGDFEARHAYIVGAISSIISPVVGASAPVIAPAVALLLLTVGRVGLNAWCRSQSEEGSSEA